MKRSVKRWLVLLGIAVAVVAAGLLVGRFTLTPRGFRTVHAEVLYRSRQPHAAQWNVLNRYDIKTVINLRTEGEDPDALAAEREACRKAGVKLVHIPIAEMPPTDEQIARFLQAVREGPIPVLVHCQHGKTRAGMMSAVYRVAVQKWTVDDAMAEMIRYGDSATASQQDVKRQILKNLRKAER